MQDTQKKPWMPATGTVANDVLNNTMARKRGDDKQHLIQKSDRLVAKIDAFLKANKKK